MTRKNIILGVILVVLIFGAYLYSGPFQDYVKKSNQVENFLADLNIDGITRIEVVSEGKTVTLERSGDQFKIGDTKDFYTSNSVAKSLIQVLTDARKAKVEVASKNAGKKIDFQTDNSSGVEVKLFQRETALADFMVGKTTSDYSGSYVSPQGSDKTYAFNVNLSNVFRRSDWRDNTIFATNKEALSKVRFQYPTREFTIEKNQTDSETKWIGTLPYTFAVDSEKIDKILDIMSNLRASQIPDQDFSKTGLENHSIIIQATGANINNTLMIGDASQEVEGLFYAKKGDSDNIYLITKEQRDELEKQIWELK